jgi:hypothetical protein
MCHSGFGISTSTHDVGTLRLRRPYPHQALLIRNVLCTIGSESIALWPTRFGSDPRFETGSTGLPWLRPSVRASQYELHSSAAGERTGVRRWKTSYCHQVYRKCASDHSSCTKNGLPHQCSPGAVRQVQAQTHDARLWFEERERDIYIYVYVARVPGVFSTNKRLLLSLSE